MEFSVGYGTDDRKCQLDERTGSDANQDVQGEPFNKHIWFDGEKTVSIYTELDELIATSERERQTLRSGRVLFSESADHTTSAMDRPRVCAEGSALTRPHDKSARQHSTNRASWCPDVASSWMWRSTGGSRQDTHGTPVLATAERLWVTQPQRGTQTSESTAHT